MTALLMMILTSFLKYAVSIEDICSSKAMTFSRTVVPNLFKIGAGKGRCTIPCAVFN